MRSYVVPTPEQIAREFHEAYEAFAPEFGYSTRKESAVPWDEVPETNRALMIATVRQVVIERHNLLRIAEAAGDYYLDTDGESRCDAWDGHCECSAFRLGSALTTQHLGNKA